MKILGLVLVAGVLAAILLSPRRGDAKPPGGRSDEHPVKLVSERAAVARLGCFRLMSMRSAMEQMLMAAGADKPELVRQVAAGLADEWNKQAGPKQLAVCSPKERETLGKPLGKWDMNEIVDASWRTESAAVLAWALGYTASMPAYDEQAEEKKVYGKLDGRPKLRAATQIGAARDLAELWHWRARTLTLQRGEPPAAGKLPDGMTLDKIVALTAGEMKKQGRLRVKGDDFEAFGKRYRDLGQDETSLAMSIAMERHRALNWLCGYAEDWDEVPTDT